MTSENRTPPGNDTEWDEWYAGSDAIWSGRPNGALVTEVAGLPPGRALDVGCGEGADAVWLAGRGWEVTALDVSRVALDRGAAAANEAGVQVRWVHAGLVDDWRGGAMATFDLVSAQYPALLHTPGRDAEHALLAAVAPGGTLLVVHHDLDAEHARTHGFDPDHYVSPSDVAALLHGDKEDDAAKTVGDRKVGDWEVEVDERRARDVPPSGGGVHHIHDLVLRARRLR